MLAGTDNKNEMSRARPRNTSAIRHDLAQIICPATAADATAINEATIAIVTTSFARHGPRFLMESA
jgi:hypothetical protein